MGAWKIAEGIVLAELMKGVLAIGIFMLLLGIFLIVAWRTK